MNLFPGDYVAGLVPLVGTLVTMDGQSVNLSSWETKLSVSLGGETASNGVTTRATSAASSLDVNHNHHATQRSGALFKVVKVSKSFDFGRKAKAQGSSPLSLPPGQQLSVSAFSPNNPASPLFPDGIMTPGWIRKHRDSYPGVIIGLSELWRSPQSAVSSGADLANSQSAPRKRDPLGAQNEAFSPEREQDSRLCADINEKRKMAMEKGLRWIIVLILPPHSASEDGHVEERLQFIKRHCGLEAKLNLFTLVRDITEDNYTKFVKSLSKGLAEAVFLYYKDQEKRIKKKRSKIGNISRVTGGQTTQNVLSPQGWLVRYDFKLAFFAEFRGDSEASVKFLESAYHTMAQWMTSTASPSAAPGGGAESSSQNLNDSLRHFSLRWYEALAILNCLSYKIIKSTIGTKATVSAMLQFSKHINICKSFPEYSFSLPNLSQIGFLHAELSKLGNLPGGGSFDYWSWLSQQYDTIGQLLESAELSQGLAFPFPPIGSIPITHIGSSGAHVMANSMATGVLGHTVDGMISLFGPYSGVNFSVLTQHPGYSYWIAALCAEERAHRFHSAQEAVHSTSAQFLSSKTESVKALTQGLQAERLVNHAALSLELSIKAYDQFKKRNSPRMALLMAKEIAKIRANQGEFELAIQLYENIANTYRSEAWSLPLYSVLCSLLTVAQESKSWNTVVALLFELISPKFAFQTLDVRRGYLGYLLQLLGQSEVPFDLESAEFQLVDINLSATSTFLECSAALSAAHICVSEPLQYQISILPSIDEEFTLAGIYVDFSIASNNILIAHDGASKTQDFGSLRFAKCHKSPRTDVPDRQVQVADLSFKGGKRIILEGELRPNSPQDLHLEAVTLVFESPTFRVCLRNDKSLLSASIHKHKWFSSKTQQFTIMKKEGDYLTSRVTRKQPQLKIQYDHSTTGIIQHILPVQISLLNEDEHDVFVKAVVTVKGASHEMEQHTHLSLEQTIKHSKKSLIQSVNHRFGVIEAGKAAKRDFHLQALATPGVRHMHISIFSCYASDLPDISQEDLHEELFFTENMVIDIVFYNAFSVLFRENLVYRPLFELEGSMGIFEDPSAPLEKHLEWLITCRVENVYSVPMVIKSLVLEIPVVGEHDISVEATPIQIEASAKEEILNPSETIDRVYIIRARIPITFHKESLNVGNLNIFWRPKVPGIKEWLKTFLPVPALSLPVQPLAVSVNIPHDVHVGSVVPVEYKIQNTRMELLDLTLMVDSNDHFVFSGLKSSRLRLLPLGTQTFKFQFVPLTSGHCKLPHVRVMLSEEAEFKNVDFMTSLGQVSGVSDDLSIFIRPLIGW